MLKKVYLPILVGFIILSSLRSVYADQEATTKDGKNVILFDDGTWKYKNKKNLSNTDIRENLIGNIYQDSKDKVLYIKDRDTVNTNFSFGYTNTRIQYKIRNNKIILNFMMESIELDIGPKYETIKGQFMALYLDMKKVDKSQVDTKIQKALQIN